MTCCLKFVDMLPPMNLRLMDLTSISMPTGETRKESCNNIFPHTLPFYDSNQEQKYF